MILKISDLQPSQLYIHQDKLLRVRKMKSLVPVPVIQRGGHWILTDGHTRAVVALERGEEHLECVLEKDELDWTAYDTCIGWCVAKGVFSPGDLAHHIISGSEYKKLWLDRCAILHTEIAKRKHQ